MTLSEATVNSIFYDNNTLYNGQPIKWIVANHNSEGSGITALMMYESITGMSYDVKEPQNPDSNIASNGYGKYEVSNILQWLNSDAKANEWFSPQHEYDQSPNSDSVGDTYANKAGFLNGFNPTFKNVLRSITKLGVSRKVHIPGSAEMNINVGDQRANVDVGVAYSSFTYPYYNYANRQYVIRHTLENYQKVIIYSRSAQYFDGKLVSAVTKNENPTLYIPLMIYVPSDLPVKYESGAYYLSYGVNVPYSDYGNHKKGFSFNFNVTSGVNDKVTNKVYIDGVRVIEGQVDANTDATIDLLDEYISPLSLGLHTVTVEGTQNELTASTSFTFTKIAESVPIIYSSDVGHVAEAFETTYQVYDEDGDSLNVEIKLDGNTIISETGVEQETDLNIEITSSQFSALSYGEHILKITVTDGTNTVTKDISFTKNSVPSVNISGIPTGLIIRPFSVTVNYDNADGEEVTISADIDGVPI